LTGPAPSGMTCVDARGELCHCANHYLLLEVHVQLCSALDLRANALQIDVWVPLVGGNVVRS
jgi:hypothetical protein